LAWKVIPLARDRVTGGVGLPEVLGYGMMIHARPIRLLGYLSFVLLVGCTSTSARFLEPITPTPLEADAMPVVIDTDMAADDWLAILYLLMRSDVDIQAITVTGAGEAHCGPGTRHALDLVALAGRPEIPVSCGRETPLKGAHSFPTEWREQVDDLLGLSLPENPNKVSAETAVEMLTRIIQTSTRKVHLLALGPLTNVGEALAADPTLIDSIAMITIMGGAVHVPGNVGSSSQIANEVAEWNIYVDPHAAAVVFSSGAPTTLVPLDATNHVPVSLDFYRRLENDRDTSVAEFVYRVLAAREENVGSGWTFFWDPLAAASVPDEDLVTLQELRIVVIETEGPESGWIYESENGARMRVALSADQEHFESLLLEALNGRLP
jgi:pyrimidine-specific ribonucleoside hydrolase